MDVADFDYELPAERIAQRPLDSRHDARLLVDRGPGAEPDDQHVFDLPDLLEPGDLVVANRTRVLPARLALRKPSGGAIEVLLLERNQDGTWSALLRGSRRVAAGTRLSPDDHHRFEVEVVDGPGNECRRVRLHVEDDELATLERYGQMPLPPYITTPLEHSDRYQTVFAETPESAAAPTAGLHLTPDVMRRCREHQIDIAFIDLAVGLDTFRPMSATRVDEHVMHGESYRVPEDTWRRCSDAQRVVAIGTTTVRALESAAATGTLEGRTELFVHGSYPFRVVDRLLTNFHLPRSSLLVLVDAFVGGRWRSLYEHALRGDYRFLSFGDAMLLSRSS